MLILLCYYAHAAEHVISCDGWCVTGSILQVHGAVIGAGISIDGDVIQFSFVYGGGCVVGRCCVMFRCK